LRVKNRQERRRREKRERYRKEKRVRENKLKGKIYVLMCINVFSLALIFYFVEY